MHSALVLELGEDGTSVATDNFTPNAIVIWLQCDAGWGWKDCPLVGRRREREECEIARIAMKLFRIRRRARLSQATPAITSCVPAQTPSAYASGAATGATLGCVHSPLSGW